MAWQATEYLKLNNTNNFPGTHPSYELQLYLAWSLFKNCQNSSKAELGPPQTSETHDISAKPNLQTTHQKRKKIGYRPQKLYPKTNLPKSRIGVRGAPQIPKMAILLKQDCSYFWTSFYQLHAFSIILVGNAWELFGQSMNIRNQLNQTFSCVALKWALIFCFPLNVQVSDHARSVHVGMV